MPLKLSDLENPEVLKKLQQDTEKNLPVCPKCGEKIREHLDDPFEVVTVGGRLMHRDCAIDFEGLGKAIEKGHTVILSIKLPANRP